MSWVLFVTASCKQPNPEAVLRDNGAKAAHGTEEKAHERTTVTEGLFAYASMRSKAAPLPADVASANGEWEDAPPYQLVAERVCAGDASMQAKLATAVTAAAEKGASAEDLHDAYERPVGASAAKRPTARGRSSKRAAVRPTRACCGRTVSRTAKTMLPPSSSSRARPPPKRTWLGMEVDFPRRQQRVLG